jgi:hypothetical protein
MHHFALPDLNRPTTLPWQSSPIQRKKKATSRAPKRALKPPRPDLFIELLKPPAPSTGTTKEEDNAKRKVEDPGSPISFFVHEPEPVAVSWAM